MEQRHRQVTKTAHHCPAPFLLCNSALPEGLDLSLDNFRLSTEAGDPERHRKTTGQGQHPPAKIVEAKSEYASVKYKVYLDRCGWVNL